MRAMDLGAANTGSRRDLYKSSTYVPFLATLETSCWPSFDAAWPSQHPKAYKHAPEQCVF